MLITLSSHVTHELYIKSRQQRDMMSDKEIEDFFKLLGIKVNNSKYIIPPEEWYIDNKPLNVKYQTGTTIDPR